jgi:hypothetical protein
VSERAVVARGNTGQLGLALIVSQPQERSLSGCIVDDLPQRQPPVAHRCAPDHSELAFFLIRKAEVGTGRTAQDEYVITPVHDVVRVDDIVRERSHVPVPCFAICFPAGHRRLPVNLELVVWRHERGKPVNVTPVDRVDEPDYGRDGRKRSSHPLILAEDGSGRANVA